jgi:hypothetical protein
MTRAGRWLLAGLLLAGAPGAGIADETVWRLTLAGHHTYFFGDRNYGGGLRIPWEVVIEFGVVDGGFGYGHGRARWIDDIRSVSGPADWFDCRKVNGTYLDRNLNLHETPRVRLAAFPVAGAVHRDRVRLKPGYEPPGNYLAVTYECDTDNPAADSWFGLAERGKQVHGKRQDIETRREGAYQWVRVREVESLPPDGEIELPLVDGWVFEQGNETGRWRVVMRLDRLEGD